MSTTGGTRPCPKNKEMYVFWGGMAIREIFYDVPLQRTLPPQNECARDADPRKKRISRISIQNDF